MRKLLFLLVFIPAMSFGQSVYQNDNIIFSFNSLILESIEESYIEYTSCDTSFVFVDTNPHGVDKGLTYQEALYEICMIGFDGQEEFLIKKSKHFKGKYNVYAYTIICSDTSLEGFMEYLKTKYK